MRRRDWVLGLLSAGAASCSRFRPGLDLSAARGRVLRLGPERLALPCAGLHLEEKKTLLDRLNADRLDHGLGPLAWEPRASLVADLFCLDSALAGSFGHWDPFGRPPYLRWALSGGVDHHSENLGALSVSAGRLSQSLLEMAVESHLAMMQEKPPDDGHRRTILSPTLTHVGIGLAGVGGQFRFAQEFTRVQLEWVELPAQPLPTGESATFSARPLQGRPVGLVEIRFEPPPRPLEPRDSRSGRSYGYPRLVRNLWPVTRPGIHYTDGSSGDFKVAADGRFSLQFRLDQGPGHYFVLVYLRQGRASMLPCSAAMVTALP